jgi:hypothetical protein
VLNVAWSPKEFHITVETNVKKPRGWGGNFQKDQTGFYLDLQLFGCPKQEQTFTLLHSLLDHTLTHEMLHGFVPFVQGNSCWTEGVVEYLTYWHNGNVAENLARMQEEYTAIRILSTKSTNTVTWWGREKWRCWRRTRA